MIIEADEPLERLFDMEQEAVAEEDVLEIRHTPEVYDEEFAFSRCLSRLREMQTKEYQELTIQASQLQSAQA